VDLHARPDPRPTGVSDLIADLRVALADAFRVERELGGGGMSRVFLAEEIALARRVVLKVLPPELAPMVIAARFEREIRVAARLQHPHIVPLLAAGHAGGLLYYTMPLVEGESLRTRLAQDSELPLAEAARLFREIADALAYAHGEGVVHRDIKPDNVLLSHRHAVIADFGVARAVSEAVGESTLTQTGMTVGTPGYMAPELAAGEPRVDHRADLYALGVVAYEMLAGQPPFRGGTFQALVAAQLTQVPQPLTEARPTVSPELAAIVHRCLQKRAADRFQSAQELLAALDRVVPSLDRLEVVTPPSWAAGPAGGASAQRERSHLPAGLSRRSALAGGAALGLLAGFAGGAFAAGTLRASAKPYYQRLTFRRGMIRTARFGLDLRTVLYGALWDGDVCRVYSVRPESPESAPLGLPPATPLAVSSSGELALALGTHYRGIMTYGTLARVPLAGGAPRQLQELVKYADFSPDGRELALVRRDGARDVLEFPAGTVLAVPEAVNGGFSFPRVSRWGDAVAVFELNWPNWLVGRVLVVDRNGNRRTVSDQYFNVFGLAWHGDEVWFTAAEAMPLFRNTVYAMGPSGEVRIITSIPGNASLHDIAPDGRVLIARTDDRSGLAVRTSADAAERDLSWLDASSICDISPDGSRVLFTENGVGGGPQQTVYMRSTDGSPAVRLGDGTAIALSPDGQWAIVRGGNALPHFDLLPTGAGESRRLERPGLAFLAARWLRDGRHVVVQARPRDGNGVVRLFLLDVDGDMTIAITPDDRAIEANAWAVAPDGAAVAVSTADAIEVYPVAGGTPRRVPGTGATAHVVGWIDGGILVSDDPLAGGLVVRVDPESGNRSDWMDFQPRDPAGIMNLNLAELVVTPDGGGYAYTWHRAISDLFVVDGWA
jgi:eukaryotic-like serine/threonine-protein kinase